MGTAIFNIVVGLICLAGGYSGRFTFIGTNSAGLTMAIGGAITALGVYQLIKNKR